VARFAKSQCQPCPAKAACTTSGDGKRTVGFPPRELCELPPGESTSQRPPTAFQNYLDQHDIKRLRSWRAVS
jgi:hypothetical protein